MSTARERIQATLDIDEARRVLVLSEDLRALLAETAPTEDVREALELWSFEHRPILSMRDGSIASCKCMDRVFINGKEGWDQHIADAILDRFHVTLKEGV